LSLSVLCVLADSFWSSSFKASCNSFKSFAKIRFPVSYLQRNFSKTFLRISSPCHLITTTNSLHKLKMSHSIIENEEELLHSNPLLKDWSGSNHGLPPFDLLKADHFEPALRYSMKKHLNEIKEIVSNTEEPTFENSVASLDRSGELFVKVSETFDNLCSSLGTSDYQKVELEMSGPLASHYNQIATFPGLFQRLDTIYQERHASSTLNKEGIPLSHEQIRLVERYHLDMIRQGAKFTKEMQNQYSKIIEELAQLSTKFSQNVTTDVNEVYIELIHKEDLDGLPEDLINAAKQAAIERNLPVASEGEGKKSDGIQGIITLSRSLVEPFVTYSARRDLREKAWKLWSKRGDSLSVDRNNLLIAKRILELRIEKAKMHGYTNFAEFALADTMAGHPNRVLTLLEEVWDKAKISVEEERKELLDYMSSHGKKEGEEGISTIEPWDWRYYAEKVRITNYNLDAGEIKPYFSLDKMTNAIFDVAYELFGLSFIENKEMPKYHSDIKIYEVYRNPKKELGKPGEMIALFIHDNYARPFKRGGAWMSHYRSQHKNTPSSDAILPIIVNNNNFNKPLDASSPTLLSFDDATTLFHEFGHGLHGMLSNVTYQRLAGTSVLRDFVELPSQLYEHWLSQSKVLQKHSLHYETNEIIPESLLSKLMKSRSFNQGFQTIEYSSSALVDIKLHMLEENAIRNIDLASFEKETLKQLDMPQGIIMRHRLPHFERK
jgi:peptidyl-dipeptidase Dcp